MGKSKILIDEGELEFWWNSEDHKPPHFHVSISSGVWEIRVRFCTSEPDKLDYDFKFPSSRKKPIPSTYEKQILNKMKNKSGSLMKRQLFNEWLAKVTQEDK